MTYKINKYQPHTIVSIIFILFMMFYWQSADIFMRHHDIGWHIAAGQQIRELGKVPEYDSWSYTAGDRQWLNISWLWDIAASKIYDMGGFAPLISATIVIGGVICSLLVQICRMAGISSVLTLFGVLIVGFIFPFYQPPWDYVLSIAPQTISLLFFLVFYLLLLHNLNSGKKFCLLLPLFMLLWVNMHGGFIIAFMLIGSAFLAAAFNKKIIIAKYLVLSGIACATAILINPLNIQIIEAVTRSLTGPGNGSITEWQPFEFGINLSSAYLLLFVMTANWRNLNIPLFCRIVAFICLVAGVLQKRNFVYFLFASLPVLLMSLQPWLVKFSAIAKRVDSIETDLSKPIVKFISLVAAIFLLSAITTPWAIHKRFPDEAYFPADIYPQEEIAYLSSRHTASTPEPIYNNWNFGGYLIFTLRDKVKVYIDGRSDTTYPGWLITLPLAKSYEMLEQNPAVRFAIMPNYQPLSQIYFKTSPKWKEAFVGKVATVYERVKH